MRKLLAFALDNWLPIALSTALAFASITLGITRIQLADARASNDRANLAAAQLQAELVADAAAKDAKAAETARNLDKVHADEVAAIDAARGDAERAMRDSLRKLAACSRRSVPVAADHPGEPTSGPTGGGDRLPEGDTDRAGRAAARLTAAGISANKLAALVRDVCIPWPASMGR